MGIIYHVNIYTRTQYFHVATYDNNINIEM